jgi:hypothetical protein
MDTERLQMGNIGPAAWAIFLINQRLGRTGKTNVTILRGVIPSQLTTIRAAQSPTPTCKSSLTGCWSQILGRLISAAQEG